MFTYVFKGEPFQCDSPFFIMGTLLKGGMTDEESIDGDLMPLYDCWMFGDEEFFQQRFV